MSPDDVDRRSPLRRHQGCVLPAVPTATPSMSGLRSTSSPACQSRDARPSATLATVFPNGNRSATILLRLGRQPAVASLSRDCRNHPRPAIDFALDAESRHPLRVWDRLRQKRRIGGQRGDEAATVDFRSVVAAVVPEAAARRARSCADAAAVSRYDRSRCLQPKRVIRWATDKRADSLAATALRIAQAGTLCALPAVAGGRVLTDLRLAYRSAGRFATGSGWASRPSAGPLLTPAGAGAIRAGLAGCVSSRSSRSPTGHHWAVRRSWGSSSRRHRR